MTTLDELIAAAPPDPPEEPATKAPPVPMIPRSVGIGEYYRNPWPRPADPAWQSVFAKLQSAVATGGIVALVGNRGTGKTQLVAEVIRDLPNEIEKRTSTRAAARYLTAMGLFLRIRATFRKDSTESEKEIVDELARASLVVLDEIQERGESAWENRLLTHLIDRRYGDRRPTVLVANLPPGEFAAAVGPSIVDRMRETGGVIALTGPSHRKP